MEVNNEAQAPSDTPERRERNRKVATNWKETGTRGLAQVVMGDFPTVADAIFEIADNPLDYRRGRPLEIEITIDKEGDRIVVEDRGGEGMDADGIADWLQWGSGHPHTKSDIGQYHKGGKAACGYLADSVVILTRRAGQAEAWRFEDLNWKGRDDWKDFGEPTPHEGYVPRHLQTLPPEVGYTRLELSSLSDRRYNIETLQWKIGNTYRKLIEDGDVTFTLNGKPVPALDLPLSNAFRKRGARIKLASGRSIHWWVGRLDRDATRGGQHRISGGMRLLYQRRLISDNEYFRYNAEGKGLLASLIGEVELNYVPVLSNKTGFQRGTPEWDEVEEALSNVLGPIIAEFRKAADDHPVSREEKKRANAVRRDLSRALQQLRTRPEEGHTPSGATSGAAGRKRPGRGTGTATANGRAAAGTRRKPQARTEPPDDPVGTLKRLKKRLRGNTLPPVVIENLDPSVRVESVKDGAVITKVVVNRAYPIYQELRGEEAYLAETVLMEIMMPAEGEKTPAEEYISQVNQCLEEWYRVVADSSTTREARRENGAAAA